MSHRDQADDAFGAAEAIISTWVGQYIPAVELTGRALNVIALTNIGIGHALLDIADAIREGNTRTETETT